VWQIMATLSMLMIEGSYLPQVYKLYKTKQAKDFNLLFPLLNAGGRLLAMMYTLSRGEWVLAIGFLFGLTIRFILLGQVLYYQERKEGELLPQERAQQWLLGAWQRLQRWATPRLVWRARLSPASGLVATPLPTNACLPERCDDKRVDGAGSGWWQRLCAVMEEPAAPPPQVERPRRSLRATMCQPEECGPNEHATIPLPGDKRCRSRNSDG